MPVSGFAQGAGGEGESSQKNQKEDGGEKEPEEGKAQEGNAAKEKSPPKGQPTPELFLLPTDSVNDQISSIVPERIGDMLRDRIGSDGRVELVPTYAEMQKSAGGGGGVNAAIDDAKKQYTSGIGLLGAGEFEKASAKFKKAVETLRSNMADVQNFDVYTDALSNLARAYWKIDHNYDARKSIREFAHLRPDATLDPKKFPKELRKIFDKEVEKVNKAGSGTLVIKSNVKGAKVFIDGEKKGTTPVNVTDVKFGYHYLVVKDSKGGSWTKQLRVRGRGKTQNYDVKLGAGGGQAKNEGDGGSEDSTDADLPAFYTELQASIGDGNFGTDLQPYLDELAKRTGVDFIAWVVMVKGEGQYIGAPFVYRVEDGMFVQADNVKFNFELSNLMVGVSQLSTGIVETVGSMPEDKAVTSVSLSEDEDEEEKKMASASGQQTGSSQTSQAPETTQTSTSSSKKSVEPPPSPPPSKKGNSAWKFVGIGGAALLVGGLAAGGVFLLSNSGQKEPPGFTAQVEW